MINPNLRIQAATAILFDWACGLHDDESADESLRKLNYRVDLSQPDRGNVIHGRDELTGLPVRFEV